MSELLKYYDEYKKISLKKNLEGEEALKAVKENGHALKYVKNQTKEICIEAVRQTGYALQYVKNQTEKICIEAVRQNGYALQYVKNQTEGICLEAVKQDVYTLIYVNENIFLELLKKNRIKVSANGKEVWISKESAEALGLGD